MQWRKFTRLKTSAKGEWWVRIVGSLMIDVGLMEASRLEICLDVPGILREAAGGWMKVEVFFESSVES
jgi:hypothetical protein